MSSGPGNGIVDYLPELMRALTRLEQAVGVYLHLKDVPPEEFATAPGREPRNVLKELEDEYATVQRVSHRMKHVKDTLCVSGAGATAWPHTEGGA